MNCIAKTHVKEKKPFLAFTRIQTYVFWYATQQNDSLVHQRTYLWCFNFNFPQLLATSELIVNANLVGGKVDDIRIMNDANLSYVSSS